MDIKLPDSLLRQYLDTNATPKEIADSLSLCGPTVDRMHEVDGDIVYDIEIITNRVDSASALGVAREASAILPQFGFTATLINDPYSQFSPGMVAGRTPPRWKLSPPVQVQILDHSLVSRFACISLFVAKPKPSNKQTQDWLNLSGVRALNNIIDVSNELTMRYGQPVHIFDLDKIKDSKLILRPSKKGEKITTLDGVTNTLRGGDIVIEDGQGRLIDLCGIMGGSLSEVDDNTTNILLFVMTYAGAPIRKTSLYLQKRTLASQLFEKGLDEELVFPTLVHGIKLLQEHCQAKITSKLLDIYPVKPKPTQISLPLAHLEQVAGVKISPDQVRQMLAPLGFDTQITPKSLIITVPSFRRFDITIPEDIIEEITRVYGYFRLPSILPSSTIPLTETSPLLQDEVQIRRLLVSLGFTEIYNNSLIPASYITSTNQTVTDHISLSNPLSEDYQYLRTSLLPSLLANLSSNLGKSEPPLNIFELANIYLPKSKLPQEQSTVSLVSLGVGYSVFKGRVDALFASLHLHPAYSNITTTKIFTSQSLQIAVNGKTIGYLGQVQPAVCLKFNLNQPVLGLEINVQLLSDLLPRRLTFRSLPLSTPQTRDLTITSSKCVSDLLDHVSSFGPSIYSVEYLYSHDHSHTFRLQFYLPDGVTKDQIDSTLSQISLSCEGEGRVRFT